MLPLTNGSYRDHCPTCLWSRHVDADRPGDRASGCGAGMAPVGLAWKSGKGTQVVHRCTRCRTVRRVRVAVDTVQPDDPAVLAGLPPA